MKSEQARITSKIASAVCRGRAEFTWSICDVRNDMSVSLKKDVVIEFVLINSIHCLCKADRVGQVSKLLTIGRRHIYEWSPFTYLSQHAPMHVPIS